MITKAKNKGVAKKKLGKKIVDVIVKRKEDSAKNKMMKKRYGVFGS